MLTLLLAAAAALTIGLIVTLRSGLTSSPTTPGPTATELARLGLPTGPTGSIVLVTAPWCSDCRGTERALRDLAAGAGLALGVIDASDHPELMAPWRVRQAPTTFFVAPTGGTLVRIGGAPQRGALAEAAARLTDRQAAA